MIRINWQDMSPEALQGLLESFVLREGTDYGTVELSLAEKVERLRRQVTGGTVAIVYDEVLESVTLLPADDIGKPSAP